jgi:molecular chaperone DnaJ
MEGAGIPSLRGYGRGDQVVQIVVRTPEKLSEREEEIFEELAKIWVEVTKKREKGFFQKQWKKMKP